MKIEIGTIEDILTVDAQIPEFDGSNTKAKLENRLADKAHLILIAKVNGASVAYKVGYELSNEEFYSWLGGVDPAYRKQGIATQLREFQENWAKENGYQAISVKSMNRYPNMLHLLLSSGYKIIGFEQGDGLYSGKIRFHKCLA